MKLIIDDANIENIKRVYDFLPVHGVTTNPSILAKSGRKPYEVLTEIRQFIGDESELHVQVISDSHTGMIEEAYKIRERLGDNTYVKIPTNLEGMKAIRKLHEDGIHVTATTIYTQMQAYLAAEAGADYAAPYINRIDNLGVDGIRIAKDIQDIFNENKLKTEVLAASFKNTQQILRLCEYGIAACTISTDGLFELIHNDSVKSAIVTFKKDFEKLCGKGKTMLDCE